MRLTPNLINRAKIKKYNIFILGPVSSTGPNNHFYNLHSIIFLIS